MRKFRERFGRNARDLLAWAGRSSDSGGNGRPLVTWTGRTGLWRWLIAALVASLVSVPLAGAAARSEGARVAGGSHRGPVARTAVAGPAVGIVTELLKGAAFKTGQIGFGWLLESFGLANPPVTDTTERELAAIRNQLGEIQGSLTTLQTAVAQLRSEVTQSEYSVLVGQTSPITSEINTAMVDLDDLAKMTASNSTATQRANFTHATLKFIQEKLLSKQEELAKRMTGEAAADGLIKAFSKAMKARTHYWTNRTSQQVDEVYHYYQLEEARLLLLRVEFWHAHPDTYSQFYVEGKIQKVEQELGAQKDMLKPSPGIDILADTRTDLDWSYHDFRYSMTGTEAIAQVARYNSSWYMPSADQVRELVYGWPGLETSQPWMYWLDDQIGGQAHLNEPVRLVPTPTGWIFEKDVSLDGVWISSGRCGATPTSEDRRTEFCDAINGFLDVRTIPNASGGVEFRPAPYRTYDEGLLIYRYRTQPYWW